jgi:hypothetical protein
VWQTIYGWPWATIWSAISALFSVLTVVVAILALLRWKKQDQLKAKMAFKMAVADYFYDLAKLPIRLDNLELRNKCVNGINDLNTQFASCHHAWLMSEGIMENYVELP